MEYFFKSIWPLIKKIGKDYFALIGICWTIKEVTVYLFAPYENIIKCIFSISITLGVIIVLYKNKLPKEYSFGIKNRDIKIKLIIGDIIKKKATIVVPTNTTFDTRMDNDFISLKSVQGQVQYKYFKNNLRTLDTLIEQELKDKKYVRLKDRTQSKNKQYEIGTTVEINQNGKRFYFLADSNINKNGQTISPSIINITEALSRLWQYISEYGHVESVAIPIIGTGRMGIINSREEIIRQIVYSFVINNNTKKIANELLICIRKEDIRKYRIDIKEISEYINHICKYQYENVEKDMVGTEIW